MTRKLRQSSERNARRMLGCRCLRLLLLLLQLVIAQTVQRSYQPSQNGPKTESDTDSLEYLMSGSHSTSRKNDTGETVNIANQWVSVGSNDPNAPRGRNFPSFSFGLKAAALQVKKNYHVSLESVTRILLFGGHPKSNTAVRGSWLYNPNANSWLSVSSKHQPVDRVGHTLVTLCDHTVILFGGMDKTMAVLNDTWIFDGNTETWTELSVSISAGNVPPRTFHSGVSLEQSNSSCHCNQSLVIYGGLRSWKKTYYYNQPLAQTPNDVWELRCVREMNYTWINHHVPESFSLPWPEGRYLHLAVPVTKTKMSLWGGKPVTSFLYAAELETSDDETSGAETSGCWSYDVASNLWSLCSFDYDQSDVTGPALYVHYKGAATYSMNYERIMYVTGSLSVYTFQKDIKQWKMLRIASFISSDLYLGLLGKGIAMTSDTVWVFSGDTPSDLSKRSDMTVLALRVEPISGQCGWLRIQDPAESPPAEMNSWFLVGNEIMSMSQATFPWYSFWYPYLNYSYSSMSTNVFALTMMQKARDDVVVLFPLILQELGDRDEWILSVIDWKMNLHTGIWWQNEILNTFNSTYSIDSSCSTIWNERGLVACDLLETDEGLAFQFVAYIVSIQQVLDIQTVSQNRPRFRWFPSMVQIGNESFLFFGGYQVSQDALEIFQEHILGFRIQVNRSTPVEFNFNDLWCLHLKEKVDQDSGKVTAVEATWTLLGPPAGHTPTWPKGRPGQSLVYAHNKVFLLGGIDEELPQNSPKCLDDIWYFNLQTHQWHFLESTKASNVLTLSNLCQVVATGVGQNLVAIRFEEMRDKVTGMPMQNGLVAYVPDTNTWVEITNKMPFHINQVFSWENKVLAVGSVQREADINDEMRSFLNVYSSLNGEAHVSSLLPGCHKGTYSPDWSTTPCEACKPGTYSGEGANHCENCSEGLTTYRAGAVSQSNCTCDKTYCKHGECFVSNLQARLTAGCRCQFSYYGKRCEYQNYVVVWGIALGGVLIVCILLLSIQKMVKYRRQKMAKEMELEEMGNVWTIRATELQLLDRIDRDTPGSYGDIYKARYRDMTVAVKKLKDVMLSGKIKTDFEREILLMRGIRHPNIVLFIGAGCFTNSCPFLVVEFLQEGSLNRILHNLEIDLAENQQIKFCLDAANGMKFLHLRQPPRIHRDLKSSNLLISEDWTVKVADFGSARLIKKGRIKQSKSKRQNVFLAEDDVSKPLLQADREMSRNTGAVLWRAPEIFSGEPYGTSADVYR